jgi:uncharacterized protein (DUF427 family)
MPEMKLPGPEHPITIALNPRRVQVEYQGHVIADTRRALTLKEASYKPVQYIPREDVDMAFFTRTDHRTYCPYKGHAAYYTLMMDGVFAENGVWTYEDPYPAMNEIKDHLAFYPNVATVRELEAAADADGVREAILHTDSGSGTSQREHWPATATNPPPEAAIDRPFKDTGSI